MSSVTHPARASHGRHRRRGLMGRLHLARTAQIHGRRALGMAFVIAAVAAICALAAVGASHSGGALPPYMKQPNPFLQGPAPTPSATAAPLLPGLLPLPVQSSGIGVGDLLGPGESTSPAPTSPAPTSSVPAFPVPTSPVPESPEPTTSVPASPIPTPQAPDAQVPESPAPTTPAPDTPAPTTPAPETSSPPASSGPQTLR